MCWIFEQVWDVLRPQQLLLKLNELLFLIIGVRFIGFYSSIIVLSIIIVIYSNSPKVSIYSYIELKDHDIDDHNIGKIITDSEDSSCYLACEVDPGCQMYVYDSGSRKCKIFEKDALQLDLHAEAKVASSVYIKLESEFSGLLAPDGHVYWRSSEEMTYEQSVAFCQRPSYHLAVAAANNSLFNVARHYYRMMPNHDLVNGLQKGFLVHLRTKAIDSKSDPEKESNSTTDVGYKVIFTTKPIYLTEGFSVITENSTLMGYPICQGLPFNQQLDEKDSQEA